ncbi:MAG: hypothetical protein HC807_02145 [Gammaproteobacteria bacterium]|nr:hypothetical protein [Gammaproteobacteria bacterium]
MKNLLAFGLLVALTALGGCAVGNKHAYTGANPDIAASGTRIAVVAVRDARSYILSGNKTPDFVGLSRGGFGNPFDILTESGNPLAVDFGVTIAGALQARGFTATPLPGPVPDGPAGIAAALKKAGAERMAIVIIVEWKSDTYVNTDLIYDLSLRVHDVAGKELGATRLTGRDNLGGDAINPPGHAKTAVPAAYRRIIGQLFSAEPIVASLK